MELEYDAACSILDALLLGLSAIGELQRLTDAFELAEIGPEKPPAALRPVQITGDAGAVGELADALRLMRGAMRA